MNNVIHGSPRNERHAMPGGARGRAPVLTMRQKRKEEAEAGAFTGVSVGKARRGRGDGRGLASLNNSARLRG